MTNWFRSPGGRAALWADIVTVDMMTAAHPLHVVLHSQSAGTVLQTTDGTQIRCDCLAGNTENVVVVNDSIVEDTDALVELDDLHQELAALDQRHTLERTGWADKTLLERVAGRRIGRELHATRDAIIVAGGALVERHTATC
jgi:hypothetical protein